MKLHRELHHIQRHIIKVLGLRETARYRDLKLSGVESSLYNYHLKEVIREGLVEKTADGEYRLSLAGLKYVDHVGVRTFEPRWQPKIINNFVISNERGELLFYRKLRQPFVGLWNLPSGKLHYEDSSVTAGAQRELTMIVGQGTSYEYRGTVDAVLRLDGEVVSRVLYFVHRVELVARDKVGDVYEWRRFDKADEAHYAPQVAAVIDLVQSGKTGDLRSVEIDRYRG